MSNIFSSKTAVALGSFDGLHKGHISVIASALEKRASGLLPCALLFDCHPQSLLGTAPPEIMQKSVRKELLEKMGIAIHTVCFGDIHTMSPEEFFRKVLVEEMNCDAVCCGFNYRFGYMGRGNTDTLAKLCNEAGIELTVTPDITYMGEAVSSTRIRLAVESGDIPSANRMLGRPFAYRGEIMRGDARGRLMGAPTANQYFEDGFVIPSFGVYSAVTHIYGTEYPCVTNIGFRPTFEGRELRSETHIIGFSGDLYGKVIDVGLLAKIRDEQRFESMDALGQRIKEDIGQSLRIFEKRGENGYV